MYLLVKEGEKKKIYCLEGCEIEADGYWHISVSSISNPRKKIKIKNTTNNYIYFCNDVNTVVKWFNEDKIDNKMTRVERREGSP